MNKIKILLAEDDENLGMLLREYLIAKSYDCSWFVNGDKAYKNFIKNHYDICILDVMMPVKDGFTCQGYPDDQYGDPHHLSDRQVL
jgi:DNA-binding response OmpR family regulator